MAELQDKLEDASVLLKEAKDENVALKNVNVVQNYSPGEHTQVEVCDSIHFCAQNNKVYCILQHESIVQEIEEVLRKEIIAASTLPERPRFIPQRYMCTCVIRI